MKKFKFLVSFLGEFVYSLVLELGLYMLSVLILMVLAVKHFEVEISVPTFQIEENVMKFVLALLFLVFLIALGLWFCPKQENEEKVIKMIDPPADK